MSSLRRALSYRNKDVVDKFVDRFGIPDREALAIFDDTKRWLWLSSLPDAPRRLSVTLPLLIIDEMWHTFVLFTKAYTDYCQTSFGRYVHHAPVTRRDRARFERQHGRDPEAFARRRRRQAERQYRFIADKLGDATLVRWYAEYPLRYDGAFFRRFGIERHDLASEVAAHLTSLIAEQRA